MRILGFLVLFSLVFVGGADAVYAKKMNNWSWWSLNWKSYDFQPYLNQQQIRQRSLWDGDDWAPEVWIRDAGDEKRIMRDFYYYEIVTGQYKDKKNIPVLEVGHTFTQLSRVDQRRILQFVDHIFQITSSVENGMFYVYLKDDKEEPMGLYNQYGFQSY